MSDSGASNESPKKRIVVYTAVAKGYDDLQPPQPKSDGCDHLCFCDDARPTAAGWEYRPFDVHAADPVRTAKKPKVMPHLYFPEHEYSIWIDANVVVMGDVTEFVERYLSDASIAMFAHPENRDCIYDEAEACIRIGKDDTRIIRRQIDGYRRIGHPAHAGLNACTIIARRHRDPTIIGAMEDWWREIQAHSRRDQISFNVVAHRHGLRINTIDGYLWATDHPYFRVASHASTPTCRAMLYWAPPGDGFNDERCVFRNLAPGGERRRLSFDLPIGAAVQPLRFDPADQPGRLRIFSIRLVENDATGEPVRTVWSLDDAQAIAAFARLDDLEFHASPSGDAFVATTNDPKILWDLPQPAAPTAGGSLSLIVEMSGLV